MLTNSSMNSTYSLIHRLDRRSKGSTLGLRKFMSSATQYVCSNGEKYPRKNHYQRKFIFSELKAQSSLQSTTKRKDLNGWVTSMRSYQHLENNRHRFNRNKCRRKKWKNLLLEQNLVETGTILARREKNLLVTSSKLPGWQNRRVKIRTSKIHTQGIGNYNWSMMLKGGSQNYNRCVTKFVFTEKLTISSSNFTGGTVKMESLSMIYCHKAA